MHGQDAVDRGVVPHLRRCVQAVSASEAAFLGESVCLGLGIEHATGRHCNVGFLRVHASSPCRAVPFPWCPFCDPFLGRWEKDAECALLSSFARLEWRPDRERAEGLACVLRTGVGVGQDFRTTIEAWQYSRCMTWDRRARLYLSGSLSLSLLSQPPLLGQTCVTWEYLS